jgi:hypothetical protein
MITVQFTQSSGVELLSSTVFEDVEILRLHGEGAPLFGWASSSSMVVKEDKYYIAAADKVHLYDATGKYLNSVGEKGRGPGEYVELLDMMVEENGNISVYSWGTLYTYSPEGRFLRSTEYVHQSTQFGKANGYNYHFFGHRSGRAGMPYQLYITDNNNSTIDSCFLSSDVYSIFFSPVFSVFEDDLVLCPPYGGEIYRLTNGKAGLSYTFNFGVYALPAEYFNKSYAESIDFMMTKPNALKSRFFENHHYAILQAIVSDFSSGSDRFIYGILQKATSVWRWYYMNSDDFMNHYNLRYMDDSYLYFTADPAMMKEAGLADRFPVLNTLCDDEDAVILRCRLKIF